MRFNPHFNPGFPELERKRCFSLIGAASAAVLRLKMPVITSNYRSPIPFVIQATISYKADKGQPVLRRFEPSSRGTLADEQSDSSLQMHNEDVPSRHRGLKRGVS